MYTRASRFAVTAGAAMAIALVGGVSSGSAYATATSPAEPTIWATAGSKP